MTKKIFGLALLLAAISAPAQRILPDDTERAYEEAVQKKLAHQGQKIWQIKDSHSGDQEFLNSPRFLRLERDYHEANVQFTHFVAYDDRKKTHLDALVAKVDLDLSESR